MDSQIALKSRRAGALSPTPAVAMATASFLLACGLAVASTGLFTVDEYFYLRAAEAMAHEGAFSFRQFDVEGAPALNMTFATPAEATGRLIPQYPAGYALLAAPFYLLLGIKGLSVLNALAGLASLLLTSRIARRLGADAQGGMLAAALLAGATYWSSYVYAIWPHMLALALALAACERALAAGEGDMRAALVSGLVAGLMQSVRIDAVVLIPAIALWLRLFYPGETRRLAIVFLFGAATGLLSSGCLAWLKDGRISLFSYQNGVAANDFADFALLGVAAAGILGAALCLDLRRIVRTPTRRDLLTGLAALLAAALAIKPVGGLFHGLFYSLVDTQSYAHLDRQFGITRNEWGQLSFYGVSKKALLQSVPFAALLIAPVLRLFKGELTKGEGLILAIGAAYATLYAFNETDSGLGYNARFLLPLLPFVAIISERELRALFKKSGVRLQSAVIVALASAVGLLAFRLSPPAEGAWRIPLDLYPQLALASAIGAAVIVSSLRPGKETARITLGLALAGVGAGAAISVDDAIRDQAYRRYVEAQSRVYAAALPENALVFSTRPILFAGAAIKGLALAYPGLDDLAKEKSAIAAHHSAGRCVYAQGDGAFDWSTLAGFDLTPIALAPGASQGGLAGFASNPEFCP